MTLENLDIINGIFETGGAILVWQNVRRLRKDREIKGVDWKVQAFFTLWGCFNVILYPSLGMMWSAIGGVVLALGNLTWVIIAINVVTSAKRPSL